MEELSSGKKLFRNGRWLVHALFLRARASYDKKIPQDSN